jgi:hypothetical protein
LIEYAAFETMPSQSPAQAVRRLARNTIPT